MFVLCHTRISSFISSFHFFSSHMCAFLNSSSPHMISFISSRAAVHNSPLYLWKNCFYAHKRKYKRRSKKKSSKKTRIKFTNTGCLYARNFEFYNVIFVFCLLSVFFGKYIFYSISNLSVHRFVLFVKEIRR